MNSGRQGAAGNGRELPRGIAAPGGLVEGKVRGTVYVKI